jgi:hypothetical protein
MGDNNIKAALDKYWDIKAKKAKTLQTNKSAALDKHLEIQAKRSINRTAALNFTKGFKDENVLSNITKTGIGKTFQGQQRYWKDWWYKTKSGARKHPRKSLFSRVLGAVSPPNQINPATGKRAYTLKFAYGGRAWRKLFTSPPGTTPQNIKHFPAQRQKN